ncbi:hypothetical protein Sru01_54450 [Sphaerisporangium rufum]|uniref:Uncharacterized protein n=1 Tax=Sphaerisporangium rufum TaxID=1381558 RepID=A0A919R731_9ACTN|nr:hypothetical protein Sru01_54450 [Sphaerisporangium rufum]
MPVERRAPFLSARGTSSSVIPGRPVPWAGRDVARREAAATCWRDVPHPGPPAGTRTRGPAAATWPVARAGPGVPEAARQTGRPCGRSGWWKEALSDSSVFVCATAPVVKRRRGDAQRGAIGLYRGTLFYHMKRFLEVCRRNERFT